MSPSSAVEDRGKPRAVNRARILLTAWTLGALAAFFYVGYFAWYMLRASS